MKEDTITRAVKAKDPQIVIDESGMSAEELISNLKNYDCIINCEFSEHCRGLICDVDNCPFDADGGCTIESAAAWLRGDKKEHKSNNLPKSEISYKDILSRVFIEIEADDNVYFDMYGFKYAIITKALTDTIHVEWAKETRHCEIVFVDNKASGNVLKRIKVRDIEHLDNIINYFENENWLDDVVGGL